MGPYPYGTSVEVKTSFRNLAGDLFNPTTVNCLIVDPDGARTTYVYGTDAELIRDSTGLYHLWFLPDRPGRWSYGWQGVGDQDVTDDGTFMVERSVFWNPA